MDIKLYRPEIDGLRGLAIIFIILSHLDNTIFSSGGVNIFFVISGYLISNIFINQNLNLRKFYKTRFFKLYPSVFISASICLIFFVFIGNLENFLTIFRSYIFTIFGILNIYLYKINNIYGLENIINPFLPIWAFCVILQFYLIFPIILKLIYKLKFKLNLGNDFVVYSLLYITIFSFLTFFIFRDNSYFNFYSPLSRFWQFFAGSFVFFLINFKKKVNINGMSFVALVLIIIWQLFLQDVLYFRYIQILLTIASVLFLLSNNDNFINKFLSIKYFTYIGKVSYPLYLIHMPVIFFIYTWFENYIFLVSLLALILITFTLINLRNFQILNLINEKIFLYRQIIIINIFVFFFIIGIVFNNSKNLHYYEKKIENFVFNLNLIYKKNNPLILDENMQAYDLIVGKDKKKCFDRKMTNAEEYLLNCSFSNNLNKKNFILIGSSQTSSFGYYLKNKLKNFNFYYFSAGSLIYTIPKKFLEYKKTNPKKFFSDKDPVVEVFKKTLLARDIILSSEKETYVLIGGRFSLIINNSYFNNQEGGIELRKEPSLVIDKEMLDENFRENIQEIAKKSNVKIILVYPIPEVGFDPKIRLKKYKFFSGNLTDTSYEVYKQRNKKTFEFLDSIEGENILRVYPHKKFCNTYVKKRCITHSENFIFYSDSFHLSKKGSELVSEFILDELKIN